jgi:hypothetical protein
VVMVEAMMRPTVQQRRTRGHHQATAKATRHDTRRFPGSSTQSEMKRRTAAILCSPQPHLLVSPSLLWRRC